MTLKSKTIIYSIMALFVIFLSIFIFREYSSTNKRLISIVLLLDTIRDTALEIRIEILNDRPESEYMVKIISTIPETTHQLHNVLLSKYKPAGLIDLEIMFVRIKRVLNRSLPGRTLEPPLLEQIRNETLKIEQTVNALKNMTRQESGRLQVRAEIMISALSLALLAYILGILFFLSRSVVLPILALSRQIEEVREGKRKNIVLTKSEDEIGRLSKFTRNIIAELTRKNIMLQEEIKEKERTEERLRQSTITLENVLNNSNPICITRFDYEILLANNAYYEVWPRSKPGTERIKCYESRPGSLCHSDSCALKQILKGKEKVEVDSTKTNKNTANLEFIVTARPFRDGNGKLIGMIESFQEITERKRVETALASERERLEVTLRSIGDGVITTDRLGKIILINKVAEELTGWNRTEAVHKPLNEVFNIIDEKTRLPCNSAVEEILRSGKVMGLANHTVLIARDGTERMLADSGAPIIDRNGRIIGVVLVFRDVTEKNKTDQELLKIKKLEAIGQLAGGIAHDFNNILSGILGSLNLASLYIEPEGKVHRILQGAEKAVDRARGLTQQLLTFSKGGEPIKKITSITELIKDSTDFVLIGSNIRCEYHFQKNLWPVEIDSGQVSQVIQNIILNAKQAMPEGGVIDVTCKNLQEKNSLLTKEVNNFVKISIRDSGTGIPNDLVDKIFDPYFSTKNDGSGLGLAICHSVVSKHGGRISVESELGVGSTFTIYLIASEILPVNKDKKDIGVAEKGSGKIMVMDDEKIVREAAGGILTYYGYDVIFAKDGREAIALYKKSIDSEDLIDVIIMDITIPGGMGGKAAMEEILALDPDAKGIVSSGYSNDPIMAHYRNFGFQAAIAKPYKYYDLIECINNVLLK